MLLNRDERPVLIVNLIYIPFFTAIALRDLNFEFVLYVGVILVVAAVILWKQPVVQFDSAILWGLTIWGLMHLAGGNVRGGGGVLYNLTLIPLIGDPYHVLRYDQVVHVLGFGVATLVCQHLMRPYLREGAAGKRAVIVLVVLAGSGVGAINEVLEFAATVLMPETNVGGYQNTAIDLLCNLIGGCLAVALLAMRGRLQKRCVGVGKAGG